MCLSFGHYHTTCKITEEQFLSELTRTMREASRTGEPMKLRSGQLESTRTEKDKPGWRKNGEGDLKPWTPEEALERKLTRQGALGERDVIMARIRTTHPDIK